MLCCQATGTCSMLAEVMLPLPCPAYLSLALLHDTGGEVLVPALQTEEVATLQACHLLHTVHKTVPSVIQLYYCLLCVVGIIAGLLIIFIFG